MNRYTLFNNRTICGNATSDGSQNTDMMLLGSALTLMAISLVAALYFCCLRATTRRNWYLMDPLNAIEAQVFGVPNVQNV